MPSQAVAEVERETVRDMVIRYAQKFEGPADIAQAILDELGLEGDGVLKAFHEILPSYCRIVLGAQRRHNSTMPVEDDPVKPVRSPSAHAKAIRAWYANFLASQLHTESGHKRYADCTKADLMFAAVERRSMASRSIFQADQLEALAAALDMHKKKVLADLPESVVRSVLGSVR